MVRGIIGIVVLNLVAIATLIAGIMDGWELLSAMAIMYIKIIIHTPALILGRKMLIASLHLNSRRRLLAAVGRSAQMETATLLNAMQTLIAGLMVLLILGIAKRGMFT